MNLVPSGFDMATPLCRGPQTITAKTTSALVMEDPATMGVGVSSGFTGTLFVQPPCVIRFKACQCPFE